MTSKRVRDFVVFLLYSRSWLIFDLTVLSQHLFLLLRIAKRESEEVNDRLSKVHFGVLVSDAKSCQRKENVFVAVKSERQKTKWKVEF